MAGYATIRVLLPLLLSMATITHCSRFSRGTPPLVKEGDYMSPRDGLLDIPSPGPIDALDLKEADHAGRGPGHEGKDLTADRLADNEEKRILQQKETSNDVFIIQGKVYCDPCRVQIPTKISYMLAGTKVSLVCHEGDSHEESYRVDGVSDEKGKYMLEAVGDHAEEICEIIISESPDPNCAELMDDENHVRISLTNKHGLKGKGRYANPLGFMATDADPRCKEALDELGFTGV